MIELSNEELVLLNNIMFVLRLDSSYFNCFYWSLQRLTILVVSSPPIHLVRGHSQRLRTALGYGIWWVGDCLTFYFLWPLKILNNTFCSHSLIVTTDAPVPTPHHPTPPTHPATPTPIPPKQPTDNTHNKTTKTDHHTTNTSPEQHTKTNKT